MPRRYSEFFLSHCCLLWPNACGCGRPARQRVCGTIRRRFNNSGVAHDELKADIRARRESPDGRSLPPLISRGCRAARRGQCRPKAWTRRPRAILQWCANTFAGLGIILPTRDYSWLPFTLSAARVSSYLVSRNPARLSNQSIDRLATSRPTSWRHSRHSNLGWAASPIRPDMIFGKDRFVSTTTSRALVHCSFFNRLYTQQRALAPLWLRGRPQATLPACTRRRPGSRRER